MSKASLKPHYVNNKEFSQAVVDYVKLVNEAKEKDEEIPIVPNYIAECFLKIANGLSHKSNFIRYTYREEMMMDAVENCLKAITNYNIEAATRSGLPNAFAYFTQITYYAFLRRLAKEKRQHEIKVKFTENGMIEDFLVLDENDNINGFNATSYVVDELKERIDRVRYKDEEVKKLSKEMKKGKKGIENFMTN